MNFLKDVRDDFLVILTEIVIVSSKVVFVYLLVDIATDLDHQVALETAILVGAVDFLSGQRIKLKSIEDICKKIVVTKAGKITESIHEHRERT